MGFSRQEYWTGLSFSSPVDHLLSELSTMTRLMVSLNWTRLWSMWSDWLDFCDGGFQSVYPLMEKDKRLMEWEPDGRDWLRGKTGSCSDGQGHAQKMFNPIFYWWVGLCLLPVIYLGPNYGGGNEDNGDLLQKVPGMHYYTQCLRPCSRPPPAHASARDS